MVTAEVTVEGKRGGVDVADAMRDLSTSDNSGVKNRIVVLGSGWGSLSFGALCSSQSLAPGSCPGLDPCGADCIFSSLLPVRELNSAWAKLPAGKQPSCSLTVVSPNEYCCYTPLLPAVAVGKVDAKAVIQPIADEMKCEDHSCALSPSGSAEESSK